MDSCIDYTRVCVSVKEGARSSGICSASVNGA